MQLTTTTTAHPLPVERSFHPAITPSWSALSAEDLVAADGALVGLVEIVPTHDAVLVRAFSFGTLDAFLALLASVQVAPLIALW